MHCMIGQILRAEMGCLPIFRSCHTLLLRMLPHPDTTLAVLPSVAVPRLLTVFYPLSFLPVLASVIVLGFNCIILRLFIEALPLPTALPVMLAGAAAFLFFSYFHVFSYLISDASVSIVLPTLIISAFIHDTAFKRIRICWSVFIFHKKL